MTVTNINEVLDGHVTLEVECVDRMLLNAYVPNLQVGGQVVMFLCRHLGNPVPSPALFAQIGNRFVRDVKKFAATNDIPILRLAKPDRSRWDDRKIDHVRPYVEAAEAAGRFGVVAIVAAQEFQWVFGGRNRSEVAGVASFDFTKSSRRVGTYYFYVLDPDFGVGFIKICTYFPYPAKVWVNGHEWAKRQLDHAGIGYTALANGSTCDDPGADLTAICDRCGPDDVQGFFDRWHAVPTPFTPADRAGYWWGCRCARSRCHAPSCWTTPAGHGGSSKRSSRTTSASGDPTRSTPCSDATAAAGPPPSSSAPACSDPAPR